MGLCKQSKVLTNTQVEVLTDYLLTTRHGKRDKLIFLLSVKAGLRAKEIAHLTWSMVLNSNNEVNDAIHLTDKASKGTSGRIIPMNNQLKEHIQMYFNEVKDKLWSSRLQDHFVISTERSSKTTPQAIVNMFSKWYRRIGYLGCSSHSGRRTFITNASRKIGLAGGSLRDVQMLAGHKYLHTTQRYIDHNTDCQKKIVNLI
jgi:integrase/recombinase XerD